MSTGNANMSAADRAVPEQFKFRIANGSGSADGRPLEVEFSILKRPNVERSRVPLFAIVRNEAYFLPHFLRHYRELGVREFWFVDDRSTDGTRQMLLAQPDCGLIVSNLTFRDRVLRLRFGEAVKTLVPHQLFRGRWLLIVDADEFLLLPPGFDRLDELVSALDRAGLNAARAVMLDFFPATLRALAESSTDRSPFELCPYFDAWETFDWQDRTLAPKAISRHDGVRPRMFARLLETSAELKGWAHSYKPATMFKVPLLFWEPTTEMFSPHHSSALPSDRIQLVIAHFISTPATSTGLPTH